MSVTSIGSAHPLRQTSFPPDESPFAARSPSVGFDNDNVSMVSGSAVSVSAPVKKKRGRKSKAEKAREAAEKEGTPSVVGGRANTVASGRSGAGRGAASAVGDDGADDEEEDDKDIKTKMGVAQFERSREEREEEKKLRFMLVQQMDKDQTERYEMWHAAKLTESVVKRVSIYRLFPILTTLSLVERPLIMSITDRQCGRLAIRAGECHQSYAVGCQGLRGRYHRGITQGAIRVDRKVRRAPSRGGCLLSPVALRRRRALGRA